MNLAPLEGQSIDQQVVVALIALLALAVLLLHVAENLLGRCWMLMQIVLDNVLDDLKDPHDNVPLTGRHDSIHSQQIIVLEIQLADDFVVLDFLFVGVESQGASLLLNAAVDV